MGASALRFTGVSVFNTFIYGGKNCLKSINSGTFYGFRCCFRYNMHMPAGLSEDNNTLPYRKFRPADDDFLTNGNSYFRSAFTVSPWRFSSSFTL